jgi:hypothetical protein
MIRRLGDWWFEWRAARRYGRANRPPRKRRPRLGPHLNDHWG